MGKVIDMLGKQCGRLTVCSRGPDYIEPKSGYHRAQWWCQCSCGNIVLVMGKNLRRGVQSCGCLIRERCSDLGKLNKGENKFEFNDDVVIGYTLKGDRFYFDIEDFDKVSKHYWYKHHQGYFFANIEGKQIALHRLVMDAEPDEIIDHVNHQKENNCKRNLRRVTNQLNCRNQALAANNSSGETGVNYNVRRRKWISRLMKAGVSHFLGAYETFEEAVAARKVAEEKYFGEYSYDNSMAASPLIEVA